MVAELILEVNANIHVVASDRCRSRQLKWKREALLTKSINDKQFSSSGAVEKCYEQMLANVMTLLFDKIEREEKNLLVWQFSDSCERWLPLIKHKKNKRLTCQQS